MVMRRVGDRHTAEDTEDLLDWIRGLPDCPPITQVAVKRCSDPSHGDEASTWFYVEADAAEGVARFRCLSGGHVDELLDSGERWTFPGAWSCRGCHQSIAEVGIGVASDAGSARWLVVGVRCVSCGDVAGVTDIVLGTADLDGVLASL